MYTLCMFNEGIKLIQILFERNPRLREMLKNTHFLLKS